jgi:SAM-dependent methyltransferase
MTDAPPISANAGQIEYWNATAGQTWAQFQELLDLQIEPLGREALRALAPRAGERIVDIGCGCGCGCGQTTVDLASRVGAGGAVVGIDVSTPMLEVARHRPRAPAGGSVEFRQLDAQTEPLGQGVFDAAFSRFGVMFFSDPVAAFANIRSSLQPRGRLGFVCWRPLAENPWMLEPLEAARPFIPPVAPPDPTAPGPFAFANPTRVHAILRDAGFTSIAIDAFDSCVGGADVGRALTLALRVGPLGSALREHPQCAPAVCDAVERVLSRHLTPDGVLMSAGVWIVSAENRRS